MSARHLVVGGVAAGAILAARMLHIGPEARTAISATHVIAQDEVTTSGFLKASGIKGRAKECWAQEEEESSIEQRSR